MRLVGAIVVIATCFSVAQAGAQDVGEAFQDCDHCPEMMVVPSGTAVLGSEPWAPNRKQNEGFIREVSIGYKLAVSKNETTRAQYRTFIEATGYQSTHKEPRVGCNTWTYDRVIGYVLEHDWDKPGHDQREDHPAICLSFEDAAAYVAWLAELTGKPYRLLSSTEFEYATRAGTRGPWFWGPANSDACEYANVADDTFRRLYDYAPVFACDDGYERTAPVGSFEPNPWGLYDMLGNAWEWTQDCTHDDMSGVPTDGRAWLEEDDGRCEFRLPRGGAWVSGTDWTRAAAQSNDHYYYHSQLIGFRVALTLED